MRAVQCSSISILSMHDMRTSHSFHVSQVGTAGAPAKVSEAVSLTNTAGAGGTGVGASEYPPRMRTNSLYEAGPRKGALEQSLRAQYRNSRTEVEYGAGLQDNNIIIRSVLEEMSRLWPYTRSVANEAVSSNIHSYQRRDALLKLGTGYLAIQYGARIAKDSRDPKLASGLRIANNASAEYQRDAPSSRHLQFCQRIYERVLHKPADDNVFFVNSAHAADRLISLKIAGLTIRNVDKLAHGLFALEMEEPVEYEDCLTLRMEVQDHCDILGLTPSIYQVIKAAGRLKVNFRKKSDTPIDSAIILKDLCDDARSPVQILRQTPESHNTQAASLTVAALIDGLRTIQPSLDDNIVIDDALKSLQAVVNALPVLRLESERFMSGYDVFMDELYIALAVATPYAEADFKLAAKAMLMDRARTALERMRIEEPETFLFSSGMDAIASALEAARSLVDDRHRGIDFVAKEYKQDYFEVLDVCKSFNRSIGLKEEALNDAAGIFLASLNASSPASSPTRNAHDWNVNMLADAVSDMIARKKKATASSSTVLVLDTTLERRGELEQLLQALGNHVNSGSLKIFLCKSYQKYLNLLSAKVMAGGVTFIGAKDEKTNAALDRLCRLEHQLGWMENEESQLLVHFLRCCHSMELPLLERAAKNANFVRRTCISPESLQAGSVGWREGTPILLFTENHNFKVDFTFANGLKKISNVNLMTAANSHLPYRDSFAFSESTCLMVPSKPGGRLDQIRVSMGQESLHELVEKFYAIGMLNPATTQISLELVLDKATRSIDNASYKLLQKENVSRWGETALRILRRRAVENGVGIKADSVISEAERLLESMQGPSLQTANKSETETRLAALLIPLMLSGYGEKSAILADKISLLASINKAEAAMPAKFGDEFIPANAALRENVVHDAELTPVEDRFAINIAASYLSMAIAILKPSFQSWEEMLAKDGPRQGLGEILKALAKARMPGISAGVRTKLLHAYISILLSAIAEKPNVDASINDLVAAIELMPYPQDKANTLFRIGEATYGKLPLKAQKAIIREAFGSLDHASRLTFLEKLMEAAQYRQLSDCCRFYEEEFNRIKSGKHAFLRPRNLLNLIDGGRLTMSAAETCLQHWEMALRRLNAAVDKATGTLV